eukprot:CAMPEP_0196812908 /NCGR_PEP_ID=MMETSP1362-20130617/32179_1 /TAXON_ID=163516 /ORGANISM="Leptocylindrus danicus, Strain CCMP1856" /LENGTH=278 /DNA_ID=CAMNT_0042188853 /DNA_START=47 /DNA_END=883 /DNA_ORIENTATION=+
MGLLLTSSSLGREQALSSSASTLMSTAAYASVDHAEAYEDAMQGRHGAQLALAYNEAAARRPLPSPIGYPGEENEEEDHFGEDDHDESNIQEAEIVREEEDQADDEILDDDTDTSSVDGEDLEEITQYDNRGFPILPDDMLYAYKAGAPAGGKFAVIKLGGTQHKICIDDVIISDKLRPVSKWSVGAELTISEEDVLLLGSPQKTLVGLPFVPGSQVSLRVEEITQDAKLVVFKKRRRKNSRRKNGHRRQVTLVRVVGIEFPENESIAASEDVTDIAA